jgi:hypothetical protein
MGDETATAEEQDPLSVLGMLFTSARAKDEFEYVCALLRIRGMEDPGWDRLEETSTLVGEILALAAAPLLPHTRARLGLLIYCHIVEADPIYGVIENMLRTVEGLRCSISPFQDLYRRKKPSQGRPFGHSIPPSAKMVVDHVCDHARKVAQPKVAEILEWMFHDGVRNAFFHSDYILYRDEFRSRETSLTLSLDELSKVINRGLAFYNAFMKTWREHRHSYKESKIVEGRMRADGGLMPVRLLVDPAHGVHGFTSDLSGKTG